jgi:hypothetical protein
MLIVTRLNSGLRNAPGLQSMWTARQSWRLQQLERQSSLVFVQVRHCEFYVISCNACKRHASAGDGSILWVQISAK